MIPYLLAALVGAIMGCAIAHYIVWAAIRDQERREPVRIDGGACICGEINARHCPVHNDGGVGA